MLIGIDPFYGFALLVFLLLALVTIKIKRLKKPLPPIKWID